MPNDVCAQCETPTLVEHIETRTELGRELPFKYHSCSTCGRRVATFEDMQWTAAKVREFYVGRAEEVVRGLTFEQRRAYAKAWLWCRWQWLKACLEIPPMPYRPTIRTNIEGKPVVIGAGTRDGDAIYRTFWKEEQ
jgi:hypothetical protein